MTRNLRHLVPTEYEECCWLVSWLDLHNIFYIHIPNEGKRSPREGARQKRIGLKPGVSDYLILDSPPAYPERKGVWIELKRKGGKPTKEQFDFLVKAENRGYSVFCCEGGEEAARKLKEQYGYGGR